MSGGQEDYPSLGKGRAAPAAGVWGPSGPSSTPGAAPAAAPAPAPASGGKDMGKGGGKDWGKDGGKDWGKDMSKGKDGGKDMQKGYGKDGGGKDGGKDMSKGWGKEGGKDGGKDGSKDGGKDKGWGKDGGKDGGKEKGWGGKDKGWGKDGGKESKGYGQAAEAPSQSSQAAPSVPPPTAAPSMAPTEENLDPEELVSHAGTTPHDVAEDGDDKKVFVALLSGKDCECLWLQDRTIRQLKEEAQQKLDIAIKRLIGPDMEPLDEEKMLAEENVMPGTTLTVVAVNQAAEDEKEAAECDNDIFAAAYYGLLGAVRHLLRTVPGAAAARSGGSGRTALHLAAGEDHAEICRVLLAAGAEVDARDKGGSTPLHYAAGNGQVEAVKLLVEAKASVTVKDRNGNTPLDDARSNGYDEIVTMLEHVA